MREYPQITASIPAATRPISFICVRYSDEFLHNIAKSTCVNDELNEFIVVDNTSHLFFRTPAQAINCGIEKAKNDLLVVVREEVLLIPGWQAQFEQSLRAMETKHPNWLLAGVLGWDAEERLQGWVNDPVLSQDTMLGKDFLEVARLDGHLLVLRRQGRVYPDPNLPGIHHIELDLAFETNRRGYTLNVLNAPSIHQYADAHGKLIRAARDSEKIRHKERLGYLADKAISDEFIASKWPELDPAILEITVPGPWSTAKTPNLSLPHKLVSSRRQGILEAPIILLAKGGGGSRVLSVLAADVNLFVGNDVNPTGDSREMARSIYRAIIRKNRCSKIQEANTVPDLRATAVQMLGEANWPEIWAFKLPESLLILPELHAAFPKASYVFFRRDPLSTALRGRHMTARLDNQIGQIALRLTYKSLGLSMQQLLDDNSTIRLAQTTRHQLELALEFKSQLINSSWLDLKFEDLKARPDFLLSQLAVFVGKEPVSRTINEKFDPNRANISLSEHCDTTIEQVRSILESIRVRLGYR